MAFAILFKILKLNYNIILFYQLVDVFGHGSNISLVYDYMDTDLEVFYCQIKFNIFKYIIIKTRKSSEIEIILY